MRILYVGAQKIQSLGDYFVDLNSRQNKGVYFYRINGYSEEISEFIKNTMMLQEEPELSLKEKFLILMKKILHIMVK